MDLTALLVLTAAALLAGPLPARGAAGQAPPPGDPDLSEAVDPSLWKEEHEFTPLAAERSDLFDWRLTAEAARAAGPYGNLVLSPASVKLLLAMLYEGAAGETARELEAALELDKIDPDQRRPAARASFSRAVAKLQETNPDFKLDLALRMFMDDTFTPRTRYNKILRYYYNVDLETVDFQKERETADLINKWVNKTTQGYIKDLVAADGLRDVEMMLANAVFFDGKWLSPFSEDDTAEATFYARPGYAYNTSFMTQVGDFYYYNSSAVGAQVLRMPYKGGKFAMWLVLPHERQGVEGVVARMTPARVRQLMWNASLAEVRVVLPRWSFSTRLDARALLRQLGVRALFARGAAELPGVAPRRQGPLFVSALLHKALVRVNERGTVAAAATEASTSNRFGGSSKTVFSARHPFLFFIEDETSATVLFAGRVSEPHPEEQAPAAPQPSDPGSVEGVDVDLANRFGGDGVDELWPRPGPNQHPRGRYPETTTPYPPLPTQPLPQPPPPPPPQPLPSFDFNVLWRSYLYAARTPIITTNTNFNAQSGGGRPQLVLVPLFAPIR